jgi:hypothetical protein
VTHMLVFELRALVLWDPRHTHRFFLSEGLETERGQHHSYGGEWEDAREETRRCLEKC